MTRHGILAALAAAALAAGAGAGTAGASTTSHLKTVRYHGDAFTNFDFDSRAASATNVDWPVDLVFWGNASVSKVYAGIGWTATGSAEYERLDDGSGPVWVSSGGRKNAFCTAVDTHFRLYAPAAGYLTNPVLGHYVIATAHLDRNECTTSPTYGWNETAEADVAARATAVWGTAAVRRDAAAMPDGTSTLALFGNAQTGWQGNHYFRNDGYPTLVKVP